MVNYGVVLCTVKNAHYPEIKTTAAGTGSAIFIVVLFYDCSLREILSHGGRAFLSDLVHELPQQLQTNHHNTANYYSRQTASPNLLLEQNMALHACYFMQLDRQLDLHGIPVIARRSHVPYLDRTLFRIFRVRRAF